MHRLTRRTLLQGSAATALAVGARFGFRDGARAGQNASATPQPALSALEDLRGRLNGTVMLPGDSGYLPASAPANGRYLDTRPMAIARVADEADVVTCINWCNENGVAPVARGGGHSYAGYSTTTGLMLDLRRLNSVAVDKGAGTAVCGGAALNNDFFIATENGPLFLPGGTCLGVGVGGLALGGGIGYNTHWAGLTCDHMLSSRIVTASGDVLEIDENNDPDLFWACRGGAGGSFGINTRFTFSLVEAPATPIGWYRFEWTGADAAAAVISAFDHLLKTAPTAFNGVVMAEPTEVGAGGPREAVHVMSRGQYIGPVDELKELVAPLQAAAKPAKETLVETMFWDTQRMIATLEPPSHSFGDISRYASEPVPDDVIAAMVDLVANCPSRTDDANGSIWSLGWVGGDVVNTYAPTDTAYVHRNMHTLWRPTTVWSDDADQGVADALNAWTDEVIATLAPHTPNQSYQNFPNRNIADWQHQYYGENFERLVDIKTTFDGANLFNNPQSIPTR